MRKEGAIYINGVVEFGSHGTFHVTLENGMKCIATAKKLDYLKVGVLPGDPVVVEIPAVSLNPSDKFVKGRIVWRLT